MSEQAPSNDQLIEQWSERWYDMQRRCVTTQHIEAARLFAEMCLALRATSQPCPECENRKHDNDRINYEATEDGVRLCRGHHHRSADCEWEYYVRRSSQPPSDACERLCKALDFYIANHTGLSELILAVNDVCGRNGLLNQEVRR